MDNLFNPFDEKEQREILEKFNLYKAIFTRDAGYESEVSTEYRNRTGTTGTKVMGGDITIPSFVLSAALHNSRALSKGDSSPLVGTDVLADEWVKALTEKTCLAKAGVRTLGHLVGDVVIPVAEGVNAAWVETEGGEGLNVDPKFANKVATPHTVGAYVDFTRRIRLQSVMGVNALLAELLADALSREIERAVFSGTGLKGQPKGLSAIDGVQSATFSHKPTKAELVNIWASVMRENANGVSSCFIGSPDIMASLCSTFDAIETGTGAVTSGKYLCENGKVEGYNFWPSNLSGDALWFGDWSQILVCAWSGVDIITDLATFSKSGGVRLVALQDVDFVVKQPKAFVKAVVSGS